MTRPPRLLAAAALLSAALPGPTTQALASPPRPADLRVVGGDGWHPDPAFELRWYLPPGAGPPESSGYRIRDSKGRATREGHISWADEGYAYTVVPPSRGTYTAEVWFQNAAGERGDAAVAQLRFDDARPPSIEPEQVRGWIGRSSFPLRIRLGHPDGLFPLSGIRGYAIAVDDRRGTSPCSAVDRCSETETTLRGGIEGDVVTLPALPEGTSHLHAVAVSGAGMKSTVAGHSEIHVDLTDPVTQLAGAPRGWADRPVQLTASAADNRSGMAARAGGPTFTAIRIDDRTASFAPGPSASIALAEEGAHRVAYYARDAAGNVDRAPAEAWVRIDWTPPALAFASSQDPRDPELLRARVADALSGPATSRGWIGVRRAGSGDRFSRLPTATTGGGELRARWDSDDFPPGEYEFQATGYDVAGNLATTRRRRDGAALVLANPLKTPTSAAVSFAGGAAARTVRYGRGARIVGRLTAGVRSPLGGAPLRVVERFAAGSDPPTRTTTVRTDPDGTYSVRLAPGPSREVTAIFAGGSTLGRSASPPLRLSVRSAVRIRASAAQARVGGAPLVFRGRVFPPEAIPAEGASVELQFRLAGLPWSEFRTVHSDRRGRFRYAYRFSDDDSRGARFQFRAFVPAQDDWPYEPWGSRPVIVRGY